MKKLCLPLALLLLTAPFFGGCAPQFDPDALTILGKESDLKKPYMTAIFDLYKQSTGENLNLLSIEDAEFEAEAARLEKEGELPDIVLHFHNADLSRLNAGETFCALNGEKWVDDLTESARAYCTDANGNLLGLPFWESSVSGCYYNKKLFNDLGLIMPTTQEDFDGACEFLLLANKKPITPICWPGNGCSWMYQFGLDPIFADDPALLEKLNNNEISFSEIPAVEGMATWLSGAAEKGWFGKNFMEIGWDDISPKLASGEAAMTFIWDTWFYTDFKPGKYTVDDFALMPIFMNTANGGTYEGGNLNMMMVNKKSEKRERALAFLDFCATPENYNVAFDGISTVSVFKGQTTNIQSKMVTDAQASIAAHERVSTASTKIVGYSADETAALFGSLFQNKISIAQCLAKMDEIRTANALENGLI